MKIINYLKSISYTILMPIFTFTELSHQIVSILAVLILLDLFTALIRELTVEGGKIRSRSLWVGVASKGILILIPLLIAITGKGIGINLKYLAELSLSALIVAEAYSILGNIVQIRKNDKSIDEQDAVTSVIKGLESFLKKMLNLLVSKIGDKK